MLPSWLTTLSLFLLLTMSACSAKTTAKTVTVPHADVLDTSAADASEGSTEEDFATEPEVEYRAAVAPRQKQSAQWVCPRREDIHPCNCIEVPSKVAGDIETVAFCKNIRNQKVLTDALKGFQHHRIDYFVLDSCKLPPFPNGLLHNIDVHWIEVLNSTVQFNREFLHCSKDCV